jgi:hypothetical protein
MPPGTIADRIAYILGPGASASAGAPLAQSFPDYSRQIFHKPLSGLEDLEMKHFQPLFDFRRDMARAREKIRLDSPVAYCSLARQFEELKEEEFMSSRVSGVV